MLVLTRKRDEFIKIGSDIVIRVMRTSKGSVKLGIEAPASVRVLRGEVVPVETPAEATLVADSDDGEESYDIAELEALLVCN
ncbi:MULTISPECIES: carbon storage regulator [unclassified Schlesneria]|uniref:carbon storage regulator n=1 Tax=Schlesneria TaxID=656899 RepID=UPI002EE0F8F5